MSRSQVRCKSNLSINRYKETVYTQKQYDSPEAIIAKINALDAERQVDLKALTEMLMKEDATV